MQKVRGHSHTHTVYAYMYIHTCGCITQFYDIIQSVAQSVIITIAIKHHVEPPITILYLQHGISMAVALLKVTAGGGQVKPCVYTCK